MSLTESLKKTSLYDKHIALGAKMVPFGGWDMPVQYEGVIAEYTQTREAVSMFDISHMGEFVVVGDCVESGLDRIVTMSLEDLPVKFARYGMMLNDNGGIIDDLIIFRMEKDKWFLVVNGATTEKDLEHLKSSLNPSARIEDVSSVTAKIDVQGPLSRDVLKSIFPGIEKLEYYTFDFFNYLSKNILISRTGYTGELGYEIYLPWDSIDVLWNKILEDKRVRPAGLGARDVLRLEMGYSLYGHELSESITPIEAGLGKFVDFGKEFIGKEVLLKQKEQGVDRRIIGFVSDNRRSPRAEQAIYALDGTEVGVVTSGTFSVALQRGIGLGLVDHGVVKKEDKVLFGNEKARSEASVTSRIFYKGGSLKD
ncbi:MAG: glycine cleavage system aminomethyltransferase GcvT [Candidatus Omnitrophica bacterium]|nr:glycine cleavage system aminomethyltransferase GcvT [Candidatus Omnitrophota bacterium]MBU1996109.1 glycine cleavage system aminomethyltransferase GcvT [Candidatus Omnitrophota bacterium]MBU4334176.1 glycine cleavage system aminomethyltransferase GcvT [Candidatus Omnitrophota bacterium]